MIDESPRITFLRFIHSREQNSPEKQGYDNLESEAGLIEENAPLPHAPRRIEIFVVGFHHRLFIFLTNILPESEDKEKGISYSCQEYAPICEEH